MESSIKRKNSDIKNVICRSFVLRSTLLVVMSMLCLEPLIDSLSRLWRKNLTLCLCKAGMQ